MAVADRLSADYEVLTSGCGLLDRSERGKLALTGGGAKEFLNGQVTNDVEALTPGRGVYAAFLSHKGKMLGDLRVLDLGSELFLDTERVSLQELFNLIRRSKIGFDVELHKRTLERCLLSLVGPEARAVAGAGELGSDEHDNAPGEVAGIAVTLVATDVGVDARHEVVDVIVDRTGCVLFPVALHRQWEVGVRSFGIRECAGPTWDGHEVCLDFLPPDSSRLVRPRPVRQRDWVADWWRRSSKSRASSASGVH